MLTTTPSVQAAADRLVRTKSPLDAERLVGLVDADCFTELVTRSGIAGRMTDVLFRLLDDAFDAHLAAREIRALPEQSL